MINYHPSLHRDVSGGIERLMVIEAKVYMFFTIVENQRSVFIPIPKKGNAKECSNYHKITLVSHANKVMLKILQPRLQQYVNPELPNVQAGFKKGRGTRDQIARILDHRKSKRVPEKHLPLFY